MKRNAHIYPKSTTLDNVLGKKKDSADSIPAVEEENKGQKKGRPTPTRKQAQARRERPLIPADRKAAKKHARQQRNEQFQREQEAMRTGDERYMPAQHAGPARRFIRDFVDARWSVSEFLVPVMFIFMIALTAIAFLQQTNIETGRMIVSIFSSVFYGLFFFSIAEGFFIWRKIKQAVEGTRIGDNMPRGGWFYMYSRMVMLRRWRTPAPQVPRGKSKEKNN